ncbi:hypothetical protein E4U43_002856 [Claviceps pusilla]|uniref:EKC/KEOPS complex subunit BUD32 n=1 Tax=Claviceps pusilla TaxID=123648 RepID=A0A9P7NHP1_9HYPO|nr:hypothetical protein E4U43_002856 [Claviceps pusilla]
MIDPKYRLLVGSGNLINGGPYTWYITDIDQRRRFTVIYDPPVPLQSHEDIKATEDICQKQLQRSVDKLGSGVYGIYFTEPDGPITPITDPEEDMTSYVNCHSLAALQLMFPVKTVYLASLTELDRLQWQVDLISYQESPSISNTPSEKIAVFKYWFMFNGMFRTWSELNCWCRLPRDHPHIVPFDSVVLDNTTDGIVGFTNLFIPGGTLFSNNATSRPFRLRWLHQLLSVVDDLNYRYGIMHQDIAPRNLLIDKKDNLRLFDFNYSIMIDKDYSPHRDDWKGIAFTLYEIITLDEHFRKVPHEEQDAEALLHLEWVKHPDVKLDNDVQAFRDVLNIWLNKRRLKKFDPADTWVRWDWMPEPPLRAVPCFDSQRKIIGKEIKSVTTLFRQDLIAMGEPFWDWERPASYLLGEALRENVGQKTLGDKNLNDGVTDKKVMHQTVESQDNINGNT